MLHVAFFRNMNLGQARSASPTSAQLLAAFGAAGAQHAANFQVNGTVVFEGADPCAVVDGVRQVLAGATGYSDAAVVRGADWLVDLAGRLDADLPGAEVALFDASSVPALGLPWVDAGGNLTVVELDRLHAVTSWAAGNTGSGANPVLTRLLGVPVTCRGVRTMIRLAARLSPS